MVPRLLADAEPARPQGPVIRRSRQPLAVVVSIALGLLAGVSAAEMAARLFSLAPPLQTAYGNFVRDPVLPFKPAPFTRSSGRTDEFTYDYQHNSLGLRDVEHTVVKPPGTFRILGLGDSFTYGSGVALEETFLSRLEAMLNSRPGAHPRVEVVKAGIPRYFPQLERMMLETYGVAFRPDLVLVGLLPNDVIDTFLGLDAVSVSQSGYLMAREARELGALGMEMFRLSHLSRIVLKRYVDWRMTRTYRPREHEVMQDNGYHEKDWRTIEHEYERMAAIAAGAGARMIVVHIPQQGPWSAKSHYPAARLGAWGAKHDVEFLDVLPAMQRSAGVQRLYYPRDGHCTVAGHAIISRELYAYLTDRALVP